MQPRIVLAALIMVVPVWPAAWNPRRAAEYLDHRQQLWFEWAPAKASGGPCVSCHTGLTYLLARPLLRKALGEAAPTRYEEGLLNGLRVRLASKESMFPRITKEPMHTQARNVEDAMAALLLKSGPALQGEPNGDQPQWGFRLNLDPWESDSSHYFTAALIARANSGSKLSNYLRSNYSDQPLHQKLMALWSSALDLKTRAELLEDVWKRQQPDGGWTDDSLGPWSGHVAKPEAKGASAYATAFIAFTLQQAGAGCGDRRLERAKLWLESHQNTETGVWSSVSMNKKYDPGSMMAGFMDDAATGYAVMALLDSGRCGAPTQAASDQR